MLFPHELELDTNALMDYIESQPTPTEQLKQPVKPGGLATKFGKMP